MGISDTFSGHLQMNEGLLVRHFHFYFAWLHSANWVIGFNPSRLKSSCTRGQSHARWLSGHHTRLLGQGFTSTASLRKHSFLLALPRALWGRSFARNVPSGEERGETDVFAGYPTASRLILPGVIRPVHSLVEQSAFRLEYLHFTFSYYVRSLPAHGLLLEVMHLEKHSTGYVAVGRGHPLHTVYVVHSNKKLKIRWDDSHE